MIIVVAVFIYSKLIKNDHNINYYYFILLIYFVDYD